MLLLFSSLTITSALSSISFSLGPHVSTCSKRALSLSCFKRALDLPLVAVLNDILVAQPRRNQYRTLTTRAIEIQLAKLGHIC